MDLMWLAAVTGGSDSVEVDAASWGLVSFWKMEEASGQRDDSYGTNHLTDNNTVTQAVGKVGNAAQFTAASSEYLSVADNASVSTGDVDFWISAWVYFDSVSAARSIVNKWNTDLEFYSRLTAGNAFEFVIRNGGTENTATATTFGAPSINTWYFVFMYHDAVNNELGISINGGVFDTTPTTIVPINGTDPLEIGGISAASAFHNGRIDSVGFGKTPPTGIAAMASEIRDTLYDSGTGRDPV